MEESFAHMRVKMPFVVFSILRALRLKVPDKVRRVLLAFVSAFGKLKNHAILGEKRRRY